MFTRPENFNQNSITMKTYRELREEQKIKSAGLKELGKRTWTAVKGGFDSAKATSSRLALPDNQMSTALAAVAKNDVARRIGRGAGHAAAGWQSGFRGTQRIAQPDATMFGQGMYDTSRYLGRGAGLAKDHPYLTAAGTGAVGTGAGAVTTANMANSNINARKQEIKETINNLAFGDRAKLALGLLTGQNKNLDLRNFKI
jgi:hypothetical protein